MNRLGQDEKLLKIIEHANALRKEMADYKAESGMILRGVNIFPTIGTMHFLVNYLPEDEVTRTIDSGDYVHIYSSVGNAEFYSLERKGENGETV